MDVGSPEKLDESVLLGRWFFLRLSSLFLLLFVRHDRLISPISVIGDSFPAGGAESMA